MLALTTLRRWPLRRWITAAVGAALSALLLGLPTDVIPNPVFGRQGTPVTWWSYLALAVSSILSGLLLATYVNATALGYTTPTSQARASDRDNQLDSSGRAGGVGAMLTFFAIGCPICNKVVVIALGAAGATRWFAPVQPWLAGGSIVLLAWAVHARLNGEIACPVTPPRRAA